MITDDTEKLPINEEYQISSITRHTLPSTSHPLLPLSTDLSTLFNDQSKSNMSMQMATITSLEKLISHKIPVLQNRLDLIFKKTS